MATDSIVQVLQQELQTLTAYTDKELITRQEEWGPINFESARADIETSMSIAEDLSSLPLRHLTDSAASQIQRSIPGVADLLRQIDEFSLTAGGEPQEIRDSICNQLHNCVEELSNSANPHIPYLALKRGDISEAVGKLNDAVSRAQISLDESETWINQRKDVIEETVKSAQEAAASVGVATFTQEFDNESADLDDRSQKWLVAAIAVGATTIGSAILFYCWPAISPEVNVWETLRNIFSKAAIIVVLFTGTIWCSRIYRALRHQATVNRHRALSLRTFQAFVRATEDPYVRDAVLMAATRTVFASVPTGFVEPDGSQDSGVNFVEFGRTAAEKAAEGVAED